MENKPYTYTICVLCNKYALIWTDDNFCTKCLKYADKVVYYPDSIFTWCPICAECNSKFDLTDDKYKPATIGKLERFGLIRPIDFKLYKCIKCNFLASNYKLDRINYSAPSIYCFICKAWKACFKNDKGFYVCECDRCLYGHTYLERTYPNYIKKWENK